ncbi:dihydroorotate dehydrogenase (quinone), mitochondrial-like [Limulus polyphemus]|uniref:Dihydroorotate dehydrogenase (quinone), mitochondrial n=1 Tax=Limulus polyphemus TaxID=6850 RepID=A0ABM1B0F8_LIMPO|nr:dihydroorotate dehydrogenase (quinone), mitochondrial-like [Limulus polyphemus]
MNASKAKFWRKIRSMMIVCTGSGVFFTGIAICSGNEKFYKHWVIPVAHRLFEPENAHRLALTAGRCGVPFKERIESSPLLKTTVWGLHFKNPIGLAAGYDKDGEVVSTMLNAGFGFVEVGSITPHPQPGNPKPRIFRLVEDKAIINHCGFNSQGHMKVVNRLSKYFNQNKEQTTGIVGVNLGQNKTSKYPVEDYVKGVQVFGDVANFLVVNVSSPNTPGLRDLQHTKNLEELIDAVLAARNNLPHNKPPILVKISPDLSEKEKQDIALVVCRKGKEIDGLVISNTTISYPMGLTSSLKKESGGLSGKPLKDLATVTVAEMYRLTQGKLPIIGVGGVFSGKDAYEKIKAGASLIEVYTAVAYEGPPVVKKIKRELEELLREDGHTSLNEVVGKDHRDRL